MTEQEEAYPQEKLRGWWSRGKHTQRRWRRQSRKRRTQERRGDGAVRAYPGEEGVMEMYPERKGWWSRERRTQGRRGCGESKGKRVGGVCDWQGGPLQRATCIHYLFMHIVHVQVCIIIVLSYKLQGACSPWLSGLILWDCGAIYIATTTIAAAPCVRLALCLRGAYVNLTAVGHCTNVSSKQPAFISVLATVAISNE